MAAPISGTTLTERFGEAHQTGALELHHTALAQKHHAVGRRHGLGAGQDGGGRNGLAGLPAEAFLQAQRPDTVVGEGVEGIFAYQVAGRAAGAGRHAVQTAVSYCGLAALARRQRVALGRPQQGGGTALQRPLPTGLRRHRFIVGRSLFGPQVVAPAVGAGGAVVDERAHLLQQQRVKGGTPTAVGTAGGGVGGVGEVAPGGAEQTGAQTVVVYGAVELHTQVGLQPGEVAAPQLEGAGQGIGHLAAEHHLLLLHTVGRGPYHELGGGALRLVGGVGALAAQPLAFQGYAAAAFGGGERGVTVAQANGKRAAQHGGHIGQVQPAAEDKGVARSVAQVAHVAEVEGGGVGRCGVQQHVAAEVGGTDAKGMAEGEPAVEGLGVGKVEKGEGEARDVPLGVALHLRGGMEGGERDGFAQIHVEALHKGRGGQRGVVKGGAEGVAVQPHLLTQGVAGQFERIAHRGGKQREDGGVVEGAAVEKAKHGNTEHDVLEQTVTARGNSLVEGALGGGTYQRGVGGETLGGGVALAEQTNGHGGLTAERGLGGGEVTAQPAIDGVGHHHVLLLVLADEKVVAQLAAGHHRVIGRIGLPKCVEGVIVVDEAQYIAHTHHTVHRPTVVGQDDGVGSTALGVGDGPGAGPALGVALALGIGPCVVIGGARLPLQQQVVVGGGVVLAFQTVAAAHGGSPHRGKTHAHQTAFCPSAAVDH